MKGQRFNRTGVAKHFYEFGRFRLDAKERLLLHKGETVPLTPKAFDMLLALVENGGHLVQKNELMHRLWPDSFVEEGSVAQNISLLRKALGESESQKFIETVPRRGYRFVASVLSKPEQIANRTIKSIAVLPFRSLRLDGGDEYLGIGIAETLTTSLSSLKLLIVRPTSAEVWESISPSLSTRDSKRLFVPSPFVLQIVHRPASLSGFTRRLAL